MNATFGPPRTSFAARSSSDYKNFIFGLLFLKRLSDRFDEECEALVSEGADPEDVDEHQFFVPKRARWSEIQKTSTNIGDLLNKACAALEEKNAGLEGVLAGIDYNDERKLGDAKNRDAVLARLVQHFSKLNVRNANLSEPDMLGRAYEYLIEKSADDAGKKGGEFYTPRMVVKLIVENRVYNDAKTYGLIVDYWGVSEALQEALATFSPSDVKGAMAPRGTSFLSFVEFSTAS